MSCVVGRRSGRRTWFATTVYAPTSAASEASQSRDRWWMARFIDAGVYPWMVLITSLFSSTLRGSPW